MYVCMITRGGREELAGKNITEMGEIQYYGCANKNDIELLKILLSKYIKVRAACCATNRKPPPLIQSSTITLIPL